MKAGGDFLQKVIGWWSAASAWEEVILSRQQLAVIGWLTAGDNWLMVLGRRGEFSASGDGW
eukprot:scaffold271418_cov19-Tisochrysis_lutea.AAC.3